MLCVCVLDHVAWPAAAARSQPVALPPGSTDQSRAWTSEKGKRRDGPVLAVLRLDVMWHSWTSSTKQMKSKGAKFCEYTQGHSFIKIRSKK